MAEKKMTLEELAKMVARGFEGTATKQEMAERFNKVDDDINWLHGSMDVMRRELADIKEKLENVVYRHELEALRARIEKLERQTGLVK